MPAERRTTREVISCKRARHEEMWDRGKMPISVDVAKILLILYNDRIVIVCIVFEDLLNFYCK